MPRRAGTHRLDPVPDMDMDETINCDMEFEDAVKALLQAGRLEEESPADAQPIPPRD
jgi:hypothetical protein